MKKAVAVFAMLLFVSGLFLAPAVRANVVDAGNKFCPVSGDKVSGKDFVEHGGKHYGLCCAMCANKFKKNPEKYMAKMTAQEAHGHGVHENMTEDEHAEHVH